jgi:pilus assembly protein CpaF
MSLMAEINLPDRAIRQQIASAVSVIVQVARLSDGARRVTQISEVTGVSDDMVTLQDIFVFDRLGIGPNGRVLGRFRATGLRPTFTERLKASGIQLPPNLFEHVCEV